MKCPFCGHTQVPKEARFCPYCEKPLAPFPSIDFSQYIAKHTRDFAGREWAFRAVDAWLGDANGQRAFLLTGEEGSGKTAFAARLVQFSEGAAAPPEGMHHLAHGFLDAYHFCAPQVPDWISPNIFAESLSLQLSRYPECASALVALVSKRLDRGQFPIQVVHQTAQRVDGQMTGFINIIQHLNAGNTPPEDAFVRLVKNPLAAYFEAHPTDQAIVLVDALDEALLYSGKVGIVAMLAWADSLHPGVRFILTSKPENAVLEPIRAVGIEELSLTVGEGFAHNFEDIARYVRYTLDHHPALAGLLAPGFTPQDFVERVQRKTRGNFLRARRLLDKLMKQGTTVRMELLEAQPDSLEADYLDDLRHLTGGDLDTWEQKQEPVLGTLAVAQKALTEHQLAGIVGRYQSQVRRILTGLLPYLDRESSVPASQRTYVIKEHAFTRFLLDEDAPEEYWCEGQLQHRRIAEYLKSFSGDWSLCDTYCLEYAAYHLIQAGQADDLDLILTKPFSDASARRFGWHMPFVRNLEQSLDIIEPERAARLCMDILYGGRPNSLVNQRILYLLLDTVCPALQKRKSPFGRPNSQRDRAIDRALGLLVQPSEAAVPELIRLFEGAKGPVKGFIALALGATKSPQVTPVLLKAFREQERGIAWCVADGLLDLDDRSIIPPLIDLYADPAIKWGLQARILYVLGRMQATKARVLIGEGLQHGQTRVRARAADMLWLLAPVEGAEDVIWRMLGFSPEGPECDKDPDEDREYVQHRLVTALGRVGTYRSLDHLLRFKGEHLPGRPQPKTDAKRRERRRLEESLDRAIRDLQRRYPGG